MGKLFPPGQAVRNQGQALFARPVCSVFRYCYCHCLNRAAFESWGRGRGKAGDVPVL